MNKMVAKGKMTSGGQGNRELPEEGKFGSVEIRKFDTSSDLVIWKEFKKGNREAFVLLYTRYFDKLFNYGHQFCGNKAVIKDCIQDLYIYLEKNRTKLSDTNNITLYLYKSFRRRIVKKLKEESSLFRPISEESFYRFHVDESAEQKIINRQIDDARISSLKEAVNNLPFKQREAVFYLYFENFSVEQISTLMNFKNIRSTRNLIYKALSQLRKSLS